MKKLNNHTSDKEQVIISERKLQDLGHIDFVSNLPDNLQIMLKNSHVQNFIPWRRVFQHTEIIITRYCKISTQTQVLVHLQIQIMKFRSW